MSSRGQHRTACGFARDSGQPFAIVKGVVFIVAVADSSVSRTVARAVKRVSVVAITRGQIICSRRLTTARPVPFAVLTKRLCRPQNGIGCTGHLTVQVISNIGQDIDVKLDRGNSITTCLAIPISNYVSRRFQELSVLWNALHRSTQNIFV
jgi:hypothetical protein